MLNVTISLTDCIETLLPAIQAAMDAGEVCHLENVQYLGPLELAALGLLVMAERLYDTTTGQEHHPHTGFQLIGVDAYGRQRALGRGH